ILNHTAYQMILPYLDQAPLYNQIDFSLPSSIARHGTACTAPVATDWAGTAWPNLDALDHMIPGFVCPSATPFDTPRVNTAQGTYSYNKAHRTSYGLVAAAIEQATPVSTWGRNYRQ